MLDYAEGIVPPPIDVDVEYARLTALISRRIKNTAEVLAKKMKHGTMFTIQEDAIGLGDVSDMQLDYGAAWRDYSGYCEWEDVGDPDDYDPCGCLWRGYHAPNADEWELILRRFLNDDRYRRVELEGLDKHLPNPMNDERRYILLGGDTGVCDYWYIQMDRWRGVFHVHGNVD